MRVECVCFVSVLCSDMVEKLPYSKMCCMNNSQKFIFLGFCLTKIGSGKVGLVKQKSIFVAV